MRVRIFSVDYNNRILENVENYRATARHNLGQPEKKMYKLEVGYTISLLPEIYAHKFIQFSQKTSLYSIFDLIQISCHKKHEISYRKPEQNHPPIETIPLQKTPDSKNKPQFHKNT